MGFCVFTNPALQDNVVCALHNLLTRKYVEYKSKYGRVREIENTHVAHIFVSRWCHIYDIWSHNYIIQFAEVEDIIMDILNPSKTQNWNFDDFGARAQFVKPLTMYADNMQGSQSHWSVYTHKFDIITGLVVGTSFLHTASMKIRRVSCTKHENWNMYWTTCILEIYWRETSLLNPLSRNVLDEIPSVKFSWPLSKTGNADCIHTRV